MRSDSNDSPHLPAASIAKLDEQELFDVYRKLQRFLQWTDEDATNLSVLWDTVRPGIPTVVDDFYHAIMEEPETAKLFTGGAPQIERLKATLSVWLTDLFSGDYGMSYVARRWRVGSTHVRIGLQQVFADAAMARLRVRLHEVVESRWTGDVDQVPSLLRSLNRMLDLELALIGHAYTNERVLDEHQRVVKSAQEKLLQSERLAAIGQTIAGLAHESRNAFQRAQASLELLSLEIEGSEQLELVDRIQRALGHLHQLYEEVRDYASPINLDRDECDLTHIWRDAWSHIKLANETSAQLIEQSSEALIGQFDWFHLSQVFRNIFENALTAMAEADGSLSGSVTIRCTSELRDDKRWAVVSISDQGPGIPDEARPNVFEPFFTTKTKGSGLGMAITKRIVEAHGGGIKLGSQDFGAEFVLTLPTRKGEPG